MLENPRYLLLNLIGVTLIGALLFGAAIILCGPRTGDVGLYMAKHHPGVRYHDSCRSAGLTRPCDVTMNGGRMLSLRCRLVGGCTAGR